MADLEEFARKASKLVFDYQRTALSEFKLHLQRRGMEDFIKAAYFASLIPDEGRYPDVTLMCYPEQNRQKIHFLFDKPIDALPREIAKLAHAVESGSHICCVVEKDKLKMSGIHVTELHEMRELGYVSKRTPNPFKIKIKEPGHIEVSATGLAIIYKTDEIFEEKLLTLSEAMKALTNLIKDDLNELTDGTVESLDEIINDLVGTVQRLGHGGMIIFARDPKASQFSSLNRIDCPLLQELLVRYWDDVAELIKSSGGIARALASVNKNRNNPHFLAVASSTSMLENCINSIAQLSAVDGAVVMKYDCRVAAFNAITAKKAVDPAAFRFVDGEESVLKYDDIIKHRGSRHQSGIAYVMMNPDSFAFVVSQDGTVTAFHNVTGNSIVCERGLRVLN